MAKRRQPAARRNPASKAACDKLAQQVADQDALAGGLPGGADPGWFVWWNWQHGLALGQPPRPAGAVKPPSDWTPGGEIPGVPPASPGVIPAALPSAKGPSGQAQGPGSLGGATGSIATTPGGGLKPGQAGFPGSISPSPPPPPFLPTNPGGQGSGLTTLGGGGPSFPESPVPSPQEMAGAVEAVQAGLDALGNPATALAGQPGITPPLPRGYYPTIKNAGGQVLEAIDELQAGMDDALAGPMQTLNNTTYDIFNASTKTIDNVVKRINKAADGQMVQLINHLDMVFTNLLNVLNNWQFDLQFMLSQIAAAAGWIKPGQTIDVINLATAGELARTESGPTLMLDCRTIKPFLEDLIEVLREMRDRMPPIALHVAGTPPAKYEPPQEGEADTGETESTEEDATLTWEET